MRSAIAAVISVNLIAMSPGFGCYAAAAGMAAGAASASKAIGVGSLGAVGVAGAVRLSAPGSSVHPIQLNLGRSALPTLAPAPKVDARSASQALPAAASVLPSAIPSAAASIAESPRASAAPQLSLSDTRGPPGARSAVAKREGENRARSAIKGLSLNIPRFGSMSSAAAKDAAHTDFIARIGPGSAFSGRSVAAAASRDGTLASFSRSSVRLQAARRGRSNMPDYPRTRDEDGGNDINPDVDDLGNPRRQTDPGPDSTDYPGDFGGGGGGGNDVLFSALPGIVAGTGVMAAAMASLTLPVAIAAYLGIVVPSLILHEMGHAWAADKLGDSAPKLAGRMSFTPKSLLSHIDPFATLLLPIGMLAASMASFGVPIALGGAKPVRVDPASFKRPSADMAKVALAGPAVNFGVAVGAGAVHAALLALGVTGIAPTVAALAVFFNVLLGVFNLLPFAPLDGSHVVRHVVSDWFKAPRVAKWLDSHRMTQIGVGLAALAFLSGGLVYTISKASAWLLRTPTQMASAALPALMAVGLLAGRFMPGSSDAPVQAAEAAQETPAAVDVIVRFTGSKRPLSHDIMLSLADVGLLGGMRRYGAMQQAMAAQLALAGLESQSLSAFNAAPVATYKRINTATIRVPAPRAAEFKAAMTARGFKVYDNERREIVRPIEDDPSAKKPLARPQRGGAVTMPETLKISTMDKVHEIARKQWGPPGESFGARLARAALRLAGTAIPQPPVGVIDTGVDAGHKLIKPGLKAAKDVRPGGDGADDNGHGSWVTGMVLWFAPWLRGSLTHYKAFSNGGATLDDVLKALTMAGNDGNIVISNSWGSGDGNPESPDSILVKKLAEEGHIMVFAAGNNGYYGKNTIGSPAIIHHRDAVTGAPGVIAVAATKRNKKRAAFSSQGPGSQVTERGGKWKDYPRKPDVAEQGEDTEGPWPADRRPGRVDPKLGPVKAISGTSMSTPKFAGTLVMLAMLFGVTKVGPALNKIVKASMDTLSNEHDQPDYAIGDGFSAVHAAYKKLVAEGLTPARSGALARFALWLAGRAAPARAASGGAKK
ncbi:MAG: S8 family serine peptidase [Elusimicrobiota bacterium]